MQRDRKQAVTIDIKEYESVRQVVLMTGNEEKTVTYYEKNGLVNIADYDGIVFTK